MDDMTQQPRLRRLRDLPLFAKLLVPFLVLILAVGAGGLYLVVHDMSSRARAALNEELLRRSLDAGSRVHDRELYLLESVSFAANLRGMAVAVRDGDVAGVTGFLRSVRALKKQLEVVVVTDADGETIAELGTGPAGGPVRRTGGTTWQAEDFVLRALEQGKGATGFPRIGGSNLLAIAAPICPATQETCEPVGAAIVGLDLETLAAKAMGSSPSGEDAPPNGVAIYDLDGRRLAASNPALTPAKWRPLEGTDLVRRTERLGGEDVETMYAPLEIQDRPVGTLAVSLPGAPSFFAVEGAAMRLALVFFLAIAGVVGIGALLARYLLGQVRPLVETSRRLGRGELAARVPIVARDELGELGEVLNQMAGQLQASHTNLEQRVEERTEEVQRLLGERTEFFAGISHELRTPIAVILSEARMMADPAYRKNGAGPEGAQTIIDSAEQLLFRVNEILELARAESGRIDVSLENVSIPALLGELRPTIEGLASGAGLSLTVDVPPELPDVHADPSHLRSVTLNLVDNAVKYTPAGGKVGIAATVAEGKVEMTVSDDGVGIPSEVGERVFEPFYRVPGTISQGGQASSGLGLPLAKRLLEAQGGTIAYESAPDEGTTFSVRLPEAAGGSGGGGVTPNGGRRSRRAPGGGRRAPARVPAS